MKYLFTILLSMVAIVLNGQTTDTIQVSYTKTAYLIFAEPPLVDKGSEDVIIRVVGNKVIIQAAIEGFEETNLFVESGSDIYMFILVYSDAPSKFIFNYQVRKNTLVEDNIIKKSPEIEIIPEGEKQAKGKKDKLVTAYDKEKESEEKKEEIKKTNELVDYAVKEEIIKEVKQNNAAKTSHEENCIWVNSKSQNIYNKGAIKDKISIIATNFYVNDAYFYLKLYINNKSKIKFDIDFIRFTIKNVKIGIKKAADQYIEITPVYIFNKEVKSIPGKEGNYIIYVLDKFTIENNKKLNIEMWEAQGDRKLKFDFFSDDILKIKTIN